MTKMLKPTIMSIALLTVMAGAAIAPGLAEIAKAFPETDETIIKLILTLPAIFIIPFTFISGLITKKVGKKNVLLIGLGIYFVGGVGGGLANSIPTLLVFRALLGISVGLIMPLSTSIVSDFFTAGERTKVMGHVSAANNLGGIVAILISGWLASISWRYSFGVYIFVIIVFLLVWFFLPQINREEQVQHIDDRLPKEIYGIALMMFLIMVAFYSIPTNMSLYITQTGIGDAQVSGLVIAVGSATAFIAGMIISHSQSILKTYFIFSNLIIIAIGFSIIGIATSIVSLAIGTGFMGLGLGSLMPTVFVKASQIVKPAQNVMAMAIISSMLYLGQFASPVILDTVSTVFGNGTIKFSYQFVGFSVGVAALISLIWTIKNSKYYYSQKGKEVI